MGAAEENAAAAEGRQAEAQPEEAPPPAPSTPEQQAELVKAREERLLHSVSLSAKGKDPQNADSVMQTSDKQTLIFGFPKSALPLAPNEKTSSSSCMRGR